MNTFSYNFVPTAQMGNRFPSPQNFIKTPPSNFKDFVPSNATTLAPPMPFIPQAPVLAHCHSTDLKKMRSMAPISNDVEFHSDHSTVDSDNDFKKPVKTNNGKKEYKLKQKTEMCKNWEMHGTCRWGNKCSYAHGEHELMKKTHMPKNFMTRSCDTFHKDGVCTFGKRCQFMHSERDVYAH